MAKVKGNTLIGFKNYVQATHGPAGSEAWIGGVPEADQTLIRGIILPAGWYPVGSWNRLVDHYVARFGKADPLSFAPVADYIAEHDLTVVFKVLLKMATPTIIVKRIPSLWQRYFDTCEMQIVEMGPNWFVDRMTGPTRIDDAPGAVSCSAGVTAWIRRAISMAGAKNPTVVERVCRWKGAPACEIDVRWK